MKASGWGTDARPSDAQGGGGKKLVSLAAHRSAAVSVEHTYGVRERRACRMLSLHRSTKRRQPGPGATRA
jgi:hypothetical protein